MAMLLLLIGLVAAVALFGWAFSSPSPSIKVGGAIAALAVLFLFVLFSSVRRVSENEIGIVVKHFGDELPSGTIIATNGEKGPQSKILGPGWHFWLWPGLYDIEIEPIVRVTSEQVGLITAVDGTPLPKGQAFAAEWDQPGKMLMAEYFLNEGNGHRGPQASVLKPGNYRLNTRLFQIDLADATNIPKAMVGVIKSNVGESPVATDGEIASIVAKGERGIWAEPMHPNKLYLNTNAYEITLLPTEQQIIRYGIGPATAIGTDGREIEVRTSDGFTFPVDVRVEFRIKPNDAPQVVAEFGGESEKLQRYLASVVRAIFRNNAENVKALDYVQQRSQQESSSTESIQAEMSQVGVSVNAVRIGQIGDESSLGELLKTQTDREIALQEQITFQEQQRAAEEQKALSRTKQEAAEEANLATATYSVKIASQAKEQVLIEASAEAEAIKIKAEAQAELFRKLAVEIGMQNAALLELLKIIGERNIEITPRVMVVGQNGSGHEGTALIGTMLDSMVQRQEKP
ncbi:MAG: SPFH domain-containing protein [Phycisphaerales bacterium]|nr:SPFH domain-containing protein [Phycisphaerales bacterium]